MLDRAYAAVDRALVRRLQGASDPRVAAMGAAERLERLRALRPSWTDDALLAWPAGGFLEPGPEIAPTTVRTVSWVGFARDLTWPSEHRPRTPEIADAYVASERNRTAHARWYGEPSAGRAPVVVVIHGYGGGHGPTERILWPIRAWRRAGMEVVLPTLPFHGPRSESDRESPAFPVPDPRFTAEGFRQAVRDLTSLVGWLRAQGRGPIAVAGMSLGGYTAALLGTLLPDLDRLALVVPLASLADFARDQGRLGEGPVADELHAALEAVYRPVSPLARRPRIAADRVKIVAARDDGITGVAQAERLADHFGVPLDVRRGSHVIQHHLPWREIVAFTRGS